MWQDILLNYGIFLLELLTVFGIVAFVVMLLVESRKEEKGIIDIKNLTEKYQEQKKQLANLFLSSAEQKQRAKEEKKAEKEKNKAEKKRLKAGEEKAESEEKSRLFVLEFNGDMMAHQVDSLRKEIDAVLSLAKPEKDQVLLKLTSPGGVVHGYGLAASQLQRLKKRQLPLTVAVDQVAASGGYMMACVADKIVAAPFAVIGSVGVVANVPNIHRLLKRFDVDVDVMTAGEYKRTVTLLGENTEKGKQKFQQELEETHELFKQFVSEHRPQLEMDKIATGEHWFGTQALALNLVDEINTSDDLVLQAVENQDVIAVKYHHKKRLSERLGEQVELRLKSVLANLFYKSQSAKY